MYMYAIKYMYMKLVSQSTCIFISIIINLLYTGTIQHHHILVDWGRHDSHILLCGSQHGSDSPPSKPRPHNRHPIQVHSSSCSLRRRFPISQCHGNSADKCTEELVLAGVQQYQLHQAEYPRDDPHRNSDYGSERHGCWQDSECQGIGFKLLSW